ncbi:MAG: hypothetical protein Q9225_002082 [Loekoesia sp. 1 TL-2023]
MSPGCKVETFAESGPPLRSHESSPRWRLPAKPEKASRGIQKIKRPPPRRSTRLRTIKPLNTTSSPTPPQDPSNRHQDLAGTRQRKQPHTSENGQPHPTENACPRKRRRTSLPSVSDRSLPLTKFNLRKHTTILMDSEADSSGGRRPSKRSASRTRSDSLQSTSTANQETTSARSQKSSGNSAHYRHAVLSKVGIHIHHMSTPDDFRAKIDAVIQREVSSKRKKKISSIALHMNDSFIGVITQAAGEDDCVEPFYEALSSMGHSGSLTFPRKADWRLNLKPRIQRPYWNLGFMDEPQNEPEDTVSRPNKRQQQGDTSYLSPVTSGSDAAGGINSKDKTPRPDISIGLRNDVVVDTLQSQGLTEFEANDFLEYLQETKARNRSEPILCSKPTQRALHIRFPFLLVEGKAYATGSPVYDAQNQAAVSGACALEILHDLDDLAGRADPESRSRDQPIVFSICTEGPYHELWAHYTTKKDGVRMYNMVILKTCNAVLHDELFGFLVAVDNVMSWAVGHFLENIAKQLGEVAKAAKVPG